VAPAVAVTGAGGVACLGTTAADIWRRVLAGDSGLREVSLFDTGALRGALAGEVPGHTGMSGEARMTRFTSHAIGEALRDAGLTGEQRAGAWMVVGVSLGDIFEQSDVDVELDRFLTGVCRELGLAGPAVVLSSACSSGTDAVGYGADLIRAGLAEHVLAVGVDCLDLGKSYGHSRLKTMSTDRCRPYDVAADGTTLGEGACCLVLSADGVPARRPGHALLTGWSASTDVDSLTSPDTSGDNAARMITDALAMASAGPSDVCYVNGHGSGTPVNDELEAEVHRQVFSMVPVPVSATKGALGHTLGATGTFEAMFAAFAVRDRVAPPSAGLHTAHPRWGGVDLVRDSAVELDGRRCAVTVTYGFGGANACLVFEGMGR
jgi:3-oxoacyl-[acyl-carrier-protein] synthase II